MKTLIKGMRLVAIVFVVLLLCFSKSRVGFADGGVVSSNGSITLVGETVESTTESTPTSASIPQTPDGKLPNMGEVFKQGVSIGGGLLLLIGFIFLLWRRKKKGEEDEESAF